MGETEPLTLPRRGEGIGAELSQFSYSEVLKKWL